MQGLEVVGDRETLYDAQHPVRPPFLRGYARVISFLPHETGIEVYKVWY